MLISKRHCFPYNSLNKFIQKLQVKDNIKAVWCTKTFFVLYFFKPTIFYITLLVCMYKGITPMLKCLCDVFIYVAVAVVVQTHCTF